MITQRFKIGNKLVGESMMPYVIAEVGSNFNQDLDTAKKLIDVAADARAEAVKFQLFRADILYPDGGEMYEIFKAIELPAKWIPDLNSHARARGIDFIASAFDRESVEILFEIGVPAFKVASSEAVNLSLLRFIASKGKPVIISTGMCDMVDVEEAVNICLSTGNGDIALLQCGAIYPLSSDLVNLRVMKCFHERFGGPVGLSDHTVGYAAASAAVGMGANIIEKHFTLDKSSEGPDHFYALEPHELSIFINGIREAHAALGSAEKLLLQQEKEIGRREGIYSARPIKEGEILSYNDIGIQRPAIGIRARYVNVVIGSRMKQSIDKNTPITWEMLLS